MKKNEHDGCRGCEACVRMQEIHGTCEYVAQTERCTCDQKRAMEELGNRTRNDQGTLKTSSTDRVRLAYWRRWMKTEGIEQGWICQPTAPNLFKTGGDLPDDD